MAEGIVKWFNDSKGFWFYRAREVGLMCLFIIRQLTPLVSDLFKKATG